VNGKVLISPSILSADFGRLAEEVKRVEKAGADWIHVDVMDGHFVPNITAGPVMVKGLRKHTTLPLDTHLMIDAPEKYVPAFAKAGASIITVHIEACRRPLDVIRLIKKSGCRAGMSLRPKTPVSRLAPYLKELDLVLVMTVEPGFGGQSFMPEMLAKVAWLKERAGLLKNKFHIEVDGGIAPDTVPLVVQAGADVLVAGSAIFAQPDPGRALKSLRQRALVPVL
jgi:ribulose-phosphate 3-epimerase